MDEHAVAILVDPHVGEPPAASTREADQGIYTDHAPSPEPTETAPQEHQAISRRFWFDHMPVVATAFLDSAGQVTEIHLSAPTVAPSLSQSLELAVYLLSVGRVQGIPLSVYAGALGVDEHAEVDEDCHTPYQLFYSVVQWLTAQSNTATQNQLDTISKI